VQSTEQLRTFSPHAASHVPSPHWQVGAQSAGHVALVSPHVGLH
jgi:hypothetical protein